MSLLVPVCPDCLLLYEFRHSYGWECIGCKINTGDFQLLHKYDINTQQIIIDNTKFYKFLREGKKNETF